MTMQFALNFVILRRQMTKIWKRDKMGDFDSEAWLARNPEIGNLRAAIFDLNGVLRGKRLPRNQLKKIINGGIRMPLSSANLDIWGRDIANSKWVFETGDSDGGCFWTGRGPLPMPWTEQTTALVPLSLMDNDGKPFAGDARNALGMILDRFAVLDLHPVIGFEMEFYLADPQGGNNGKPDAPASPLTGAKPIRDGVLAIDEVNDYDSLINEIYAACKLQMIEADTTISEAGLGQFEINLVHSHDAMKAADDAAFFKQIAKGVARKYGLAASFMAKPYADRPGNGMHLHVSLLDGKGKNVFDDGSDAGSPILGHALAGALAGLADSMLIFAPHQNSYRRFAIESHAPMAVCWGYENRTAALRVPLGLPSQRRIEHRVSGADANPYLVLAAILGAILTGLEDQKPPPPPITSSSYALDLPTLPSSWDDAINHFTNSTVIARILPETLRDMLIGCKIQELQRFSGDISPFEYHSYLDQV